MPPAMRAAMLIPIMEEPGEQTAATETAYMEGKGRGLRLEHGGPLPAPSTPAEPAVVGRVETQQAEPVGTEAEARAETGCTKYPAARKERIIRGQLLEVTVLRTPEAEGEAEAEACVAVIG